MKDNNLNKFKHLQYMENINLEAFAPYLHKHITGPVEYGVKLDVPAVLENQELAQIGLVDITAAPFEADPRGLHDSTSAIQNAVDFARDHQMICWFPQGEYRVSDTISCIQNPRFSREGAVIPARNFPCVLMGSRVNQGKRPKLVLVPESSGFTDSENPKQVIHFWARGTHGSDTHKSQPNICMNQMLINIDIEIGQGNAGAIAVSLQGAQGSGVQDCTIDASHGYCGLAGGVGSGGCHARITVIGGEIGLDLQKTNPVPTIVGINLEGQTKHAILFSGAQAMAAVGMKIISNCSGPAIAATINDNVVPFTGHMSLVDCELILKKADKTTASIGISTGANVYLQNCYFKHATKVVVNADGSSLAGNPAGWLEVLEYAHAITPNLIQDPVFAEVNYQYTFPIYMDGEQHVGDMVTTSIDVAPSEDLVSKHLWEDDFPSWESSSALNVKKAPYSAVGDGYADDTMALQQAIDAHEIVFLPKGYYRVSRTIYLRPKTKLVGVGLHLSVIMIRGDEPFFSNSQTPQPLLATADQKSADTVMAFCSTEVPIEATGAYALKWRCGRKSVYRCARSGFTPKSIEAVVSEPNYPHPTFPPRLKPLVVITGGGGGKWYAHTEDMAPYIPGPEYRHLLVAGTDEPLYFYQCNPEHTYHGEVNMEIRDAANVVIHGLKSEGHEVVLLIKNSSRISVFSCGGIGNAESGKSLFRISNSTHVRLVNVMDILMWANDSGNHWSNEELRTKGVIYFNDPRTWVMVEEQMIDGNVIKVLPLERPLLYASSGRS